MTLHMDYKNTYVCTHTTEPHTHKPHTYIHIKTHTHTLQVQRRKFAHNVFLRRYLKALQ